MEEWFENWFDTEYYHILYKNRNQEEAELFIQNLANHLQLTKQQKILDLACGKGRHALFLNKLGFEVLGLDLSAQSINFAKKQQNETLKFDVHDMRKVYAQDSFDVVVNLFTSFGYFIDKQDNRKVIESIYTQLKSNGKLVIDFMNSKKMIHQIIPMETKQIDGILFHITKKYEEGFIIKQIEFTDKNKPYTFQEKVQALQLNDFTTLTKDLFSLKNVFGNYNLEKYDENSSDRVILEFQKI